MSKYNLEDFLKIKSSFATSFSPDGDKVAVLSNLSGTFQIYLMDINGGELEQLTSYDDSVNFVSFSPTDNVMMFGMSKDGNENMQLYLYDLSLNIKN